MLEEKVNKVSEGIATIIYADKDARKELEYEKDNVTNFQSLSSVKPRKTYILPEILSKNNRNTQSSPNLTIYQKMVSDSYSVVDTIFSNEKDIEILNKTIDYSKPISRVKMNKTAATKKINTPEV